MPSKGERPPVALEKKCVHPEMGETQTRKLGARLMTPDWAVYTTAWISREIKGYQI
jgi:hypothetical protein